ncbi:MAG: nickel pincer cofactor biosynthesis protein LarC [Pseudomonadaceae bacterium]|nr:nickel pincer cofactor biosynthesis protein LarC [Pseudomonadaceae bacterium]
MSVRTNTVATALLYQPSAGISGDMNLAALIDLGADPAHIRRELGKLPLNGEFDLRVSKASKMGVHGTRVDVVCADQSDHRHHSNIARMIREANLDPEVTDLALSVFQHIAKAEAKIHDIDIDQVHFHEVGAIDSIVDIVGGAIALVELKWRFGIRDVLTLPIELGSGFVNCAHGRLAVPAPATQELVQGLPCLYGGVDGESTTPTGAGLLAAQVTRPDVPEPMLVRKTGYGIGHKDFASANVLRVAIIDSADAVKAPSSGQSYFHIEANIDDMPAEAFEPLAQSLFAQGADDVYFSPIIMKKSRPATCISVLCDAAHRDALADTILNESSTIGLRYKAFEKRVLERETRKIPTALGEVAIKIVTQPNGQRRWKMEHDDIVALAGESGLDYATARRRADRDIADYLNAGDDDGLEPC